MFVPDQLSLGTEFRNFFRTLLPGLSEDDLGLLEILYPDPIIDATSPYKEDRKGLGAQFKRLEQAYGQFAYVAPVRQTVQFAAQAGVTAYLYHFDVGTTVKGRADHGTHNRFVTYNPDIREASKNLGEVSGLMHAYWTSFITTGDPNAVPGRFKGRMKWPKYNPDEGRLLMFGEGNNELAGGGPPLFSKIFKRMGTARYGD